TRTICGCFVSRQAGVSRGICSKGTTWMRGVPDMCFSSGSTITKTAGYGLTFFGGSQGSAGLAKYHRIVSDTAATLWQDRIRFRVVIASLTLQRRYRVAE